MSMEPNSPAVAAAWLETFGDAVTAGDVPRVVSCFAPEGYMRDVLVFTWMNRTLAGRSRIAAYLNDTLKPATITSVKIDTRPHLTPEYGPVTHAASGVSSGFTFDTLVGPAQGYFSLVQDAEGVWKALMVFTVLADIRGHEEMGPELGVYNGHTIPWHDVHGERREAIERDPRVIIIGGGQTGLNVAARFKQMNIPSLIIERNSRIGDNWRKRYPTLTLHTINTHHGMLYQPYPANWPIFTPRDKLADWLEQYATSQDLVFWTNAEVLPTPTYDAAAKRWTAVIDRAGVRITLHPAHIIVATGTLGAPYTPTIPDAHLFAGPALHAATYMGGKPFAGKRALVVGAGNTAADICQDLSYHGAAQVTMLQRSSTCVIAVDGFVSKVRQKWPPGVPTEVSDFKVQAIPYLLVRAMAKATTEATWAEEAETHKGLREAGLSLNMGEEGEGVVALSHQRYGGYWLDIGVAELIRTGQVKVKQGVEIARFTENSAVFTDGSSLAIDAVIYATSYYNVRDTMRELFGAAVIDKANLRWGTDEEGELSGCYCPSGHPGLWYAAGDFYMSRFRSKQLALTIKALELGMTV
ncbi:FAD/NAD-P-binding domain-containing protein [Mycena rosella]|uniref:FAD/NAD-P-binding domain-containing protein n=1 Tax=Mycena rosella TaxID=1033263 RepID=A0AAD7CTH7_MYCRO|nr:FAD/NAD-P-binding domain-containing protein [Mycena rosella]